MVDALFKEKEHVKNKENSCMKTCNHFIKNKRDEIYLGAKKKRELILCQKVVKWITIIFSLFSSIYEILFKSSNKTIIGFQPETCLS